MTGDSAITEKLEQADTMNLDSVVAANERALKQEFGAQVRQRNYLAQDVFTLFHRATDTIDPVMKAKVEVSPAFAAVAQATANIDTAVQLEQQTTAQQPYPHEQDFSAKLQGLQLA